MIRYLMVVLVLSVTSLACAQTTQPIARKAYDAPPKMAIDVNKTYTATINTDKGKIVCELFPKDAPQTVNSFVFLARDHFYDGLTFHRVVPDFVIQGGDPNGDGSGGPGYTLPLEAKDNPHLHDTGALAMARTNDPDSAGSQFYITLSPQHSLDPGALIPDQNGNITKSPGYTVFGNVIDGKDVPAKIGMGDKISSITIEEK
jgi:cyclophilin family peptidyl-prolyl cis-trans isomerase